MVTETADTTRRCYPRAAAARYLSVSVRMIDSLIAKHRLPAVRIGARIVLDQHDLDAFIADAKKADHLGGS